MFLKRLMCKIVFFKRKLQNLVTINLISKKPISIEIGFVFR
jgi:hypothetical protein